MAAGRIGVALRAPSPRAMVDLIAEADEVGVPSVWLPTGFAQPDALTILAAAATRTTGIKLGTAIMPTYTRHPLVMAQQAQVVADLAPGRFVLGIGPSHKVIIEQTFGLPFEQPLAHLKEYVTVLRDGLHHGAVNFTGKHWHARGRVPYPAPVPIMVSALRPRAIRLAAEIADGVLANFCPVPYVRDTLVPVLDEAAREAKRPRPPLITRAFIALSTDREAVMQAARARLSVYAEMPFYHKMMIAAGFPEADGGHWSERMLDAVVIFGDEEDVGKAMGAFLNESGADELTVNILPVAPDAKAHLTRAFQLIAAL